MTSKKLLTSDTRATELISGVSLMIISLLILFTGEKFFPPHLGNVHEWHFWGIVSGVFGFIQVIAIMIDDTENIRAVTSWFAGAYWLWSGTYQLSLGQGQLYDIVLIVLGISSMYAFVINLLTIKAKELWN